jgi:GAF domain-containing protein
MKRHVDIGADILSLVNFPYPVVPIVRCHHENWDGTGYPRGVKAEDIPIGARILSVVDCFDALTSDRPYRRRLSHRAALDILLERRGRMYDPRVVDTFIQVYRTIAIDRTDSAEEQQVLERISRSRQAAPSAAVSSEAGGAAPAGPARIDSDALAFVSLARLASGAGTLADLLSLSTKLVKDLAPGMSGAWYIVSDGGDRLTALEAFGTAGGFLTGQTVRMGDRLTGWVAASRQVILNSDAALDLGDGTSHGGATLRSCLSVPLLAGDALAGVLTLYSSERNGFSEDQSRLVQMVAPHIAAGIDVARKRAEPPHLQQSRDLKLVASR